MGRHRGKGKPQGGLNAPSRATALGDTLRAIVTGQIVGLAVGWLVRFAAVLLLGFGAISLSVGWLQGVKPILEAREFSAFTGRTEARIVESWLALEVDGARVGDGGNWRAAAMASPCAVVAYEGDWGTTARRAFCGNRLGFNEAYTLHDLRHMAPDIPFAWARDAAGFAVPEIRVSAQTTRWLANVKPQMSARSGPPPASALAQLALDADQPVNTAVASWASTQPAFALAYDPKDPGGAMPEAYVQARRAAGLGWVLGFVFLAVGFGIWFRGTLLLLPAMPLPVHLVLAALPLVFLPQWGEVMPRYLRHLHPAFAAVVGDMIGDLDITGRLVASDPAQAQLADGEILRWPVGGGAHAATIGRLHFTKPEPAPVDGDEALAALAAATTVQVAAMPEDRRVALFAQLERDKWASRPEAGLAFLPAARQAVLDANAPKAVRKAAGDFLSAWVTQPVEEPWPRDAGFRERIRLFRSLVDVPVTGVPVMSQSIAERATERAAAQGQRQPR